jgi:hypothetical protein
MIRILFKAVIQRVRRGGIVGWDCNCVCVRFSEANFVFVNFSQMLVYVPVIREIGSVNKTCLFSWLRYVHITNYKILHANQM